MIDTKKHLVNAEPLYDGELSELTEQIINSVTGDEKKIIEFLEIQSLTSIFYIEN